MLSTAYDYFLTFPGCIDCGQQRYVIGQLGSYYSPAQRPALYNAVVANNFQLADGSELPWGNVLFLRMADWQSNPSTSMIVTQTVLPIQPFEFGAVTSNVAQYYTQKAQFGYVGPWYLLVSGNAAGLIQGAYVSPDQGCPGPITIPAPPLCTESEDVVYQHAGGTDQGAEYIFSWNGDYGAGCLANGQARPYFGQTG